jgi:hypothetical protein
MYRNFRANFTAGLLICGLLCTLAACHSGGGDSIVDPQQIGAQKGNYVALAWNDLGMHCLNPSYDTAVILPPYNNVWVQVIKRGNKPEVVTNGIKVEYRMINNTTSANKGNFGQFWTNALALFGVTLAPDTGLNLVDPDVHNTLSGTMLAKDDHFQVNGIPVTPIDDAQHWDPYQVMEITVRDTANNVLITTQTTVPTSDEINCAKCHVPSAANNFNPFLDILQKHDRLHQPPDGLLVPQQPVLCAKCHGSPALGQSGPGDSGKYLSQAIHHAHASRTAPDGSPISCLDCHPGQSTMCNRSLKHTSPNGNCTTCHGDLNQIADSISNGRIPWATEPRCDNANCHPASIPEVDTGTTLYRNAKGHGGLYCAGCHGSPHAMTPSRVASDNYQMLQYQNGAKSLGSCGVCHSGSKGAGSHEFIAQHGKGGSACDVCHTGFVNPITDNWPHAFQWQNR